MKWIKISDQLPLFDERVLLYDISTKSIDVGFLDKEYSERVEFLAFYIADIGNMPLNRYDFWMPLPEAPVDK